MERKLTDRKEESRFMALFVGRHHSGKTVAEASFPKPMMVEDFDGRIGGANVSFLDLTGLTYEYWEPRSPSLVQDINAKLEKYDDIRKMQALGQNMVQLPKTHVTDSITNMTFAFICQSRKLTHGDDKNKKGRWLGPVSMAEPTDYGFEAQATYDYISFLKSLPIQNIIVSAHLIDEYGQPKDEDNNDIPYAPKEVIGQKLSIRDKIGENIQTSFDHIFKFERKTIAGQDKFYVTFRGGIACTSYNWLPTGQKEWTGKKFYDFMWSFKKASPEKEEITIEPSAATIVGAK